MGIDSRPIRGVVFVDISTIRSSSGSWISSLLWALIVFRMITFCDASSLIRKHDWIAGGKLGGTREHAFL